MNKNTEVYKISDKRFKFQYDGNFKNLSKFKKSVCDITLSINPLAWYILNGTVKVKPRERGLQGGYEQCGKLPTEWQFLRKLLFCAAGAAPF